MQSISVYHVDTFTDQLFNGNPAAVCVLTAWLDDQKLNAIARENNLPATAFLVHEADNLYSTRWITPEYELDLCGHGTLATGFIVFNYLQPTLSQIQLRSKKELLTVIKQHDLTTLNFPSMVVTPLDALAILSQGLGLAPKEVHEYQQERILAVYDHENDIKKIKPDMSVLRQLKHRGIVITAKASELDFVSRSFYPQKSISEDPATGASHCLLVPYWAERLHKANFHAKQLSQRGGEMFCELKGDRVLLSGKAVLYSRGEVYLL